MSKQQTFTIKDVGAVEKDWQGNIGTWVGENDFLRNKKGLTIAAWSSRRSFPLARPHRVHQGVSPELSKVSRIGSYVGMKHVELTRNAP
jgi:hypothetical protein